MRRDQFERQSRFTDAYIQSMRQGISIVELTKEYVLSLHREADEILDEVPWKGHRVYADGDEVVKSNVAEEIVDSMKFLMGLAHIWGIDHEELEAEFDVKSDVVEDRWRQEHGETAFLQSSSPIVLLDLDGVLNHYPDPFIQFVQERNSGVDLSTMAKIEEWPLVKARMKHEYRQSGIKRRLPANNESVVAAQMLQAKGYAIVIMSQRPVDRYHRIYGDTLYWLRANEVPYDRLVFVTAKEHRLLLAPYLSRIEFAVDDDPEVVESLTSLGIETFWLTPPLSVIEKAKLVVPDKATVVNSMLQIPAVRGSADSFRRGVRYGNQ